MEKLELKHFAAYLPFKLKLACGFQHEKVETMLFLGDDDVMTSTDEYPFCHVKPILRKLSDLTKEIEINGDKFIPLNKIWNMFDLQIDFMELITDEANIDNVTNILHYDCICYLISLHFDIFGLIEKGLAIDINTLKQ